VTAPVVEAEEVAEEEAAVVVEIGRVTIVDRPAI